MKKLTLAYFGSPSFSALFLEKILTDPDLKKTIEVKLVVTQPDRPVGRKQILTETPVKKVAKKYQISNIKYQIDIRNLKLEIRNFDLALIYAFSHIIPKDLLNAPKLGFWNIHPSLLPKYRGPSPIAYPLFFGEKETGVTIIKMDEKIDHGPIIAQEKLKIEESDRRPDLEKKLTDLGFLMFKKLILNNFNASTSLSINQFQPISTSFNQFQLTPQADQNATYTRLLKKQDGFIPLSTLKKALKNEPLKFEEMPPILKEIRNWKSEISNSSEIIYNYFRGLYPWPGLWTLLPNGKRLKIIDIDFEVTSSTTSDVVIKLQVTRVQLEGKKEVDFETFNQAYQVF
jgi:methionyl-tRNA formyltransferase